MEPSVIKVLIVDDHPLVRMGIRRLLEDLPDIAVIADAEDGRQALDLIKLHKPNVVLLDMKMPRGMDGMEVIRRLKKTQPQIKMIAVTALCSEPFPSMAFQLGAMGYITKDSGAEEMAIAIRRVAKGQKYISTDIAQKMAINSLDDSQGSPFNLLSRREMQVMLMITTGMTVQAVASKLHLSTKTINGCRYRMYDKLGVSNDVELAILAMQYQIIEQPRLRSEISRSL